MVRQRIHSGQGFFGSLDTSWSEWSWIDVFSKETQNPFSDLRIQSWIFLKKRTLSLGKGWKLLWATLSYLLSN